LKKPAKKPAPNLIQFQVVMPVVIEGFLMLNQSTSCPTAHSNKKNPGYSEPRWEGHPTYKKAAFSVGGTDPTLINSRKVGRLNKNQKYY